MSRTKLYSHDNNAKSGGTVGGRASTLWWAFDEGILYIAVGPVCTGVPGNQITPAISNNN